jgi:ectoine hydroxylase
MAMKYTEEINLYKKNGFVVRDSFFDEAHVKLMKQEASRYLDIFQTRGTIDGEDFLYEDASKTLRLVRNVHQTNECFNSVANNKNVKKLSEKLTGNKTILLNTKLNFKNAFTGGQFDWHQDSIYFDIGHKKSIAFIIAVDDVSHINGPIMVIPQSHRNGTIEVPHRDQISENERTEYPKERTENLSYSLPNNILSEEAGRYGVESLIGKSGTLFAMDCSTFHASNLNLSPFNRTSFLIRYQCEDV